MIFLFEQFAYSLDYLKTVLPTDKEGRFVGLPNGFVGRDCKLDGVGYLYNKSAKKNINNVADNIVFVLPKVFVDNGKTAFGKEIKNDKNFVLSDSPKEFLSTLSLWVCSSIGQYHQENSDAGAIDIPEAHQFSNAKEPPTLINVMNAMKSFYADNQNLFVFTAKNKHSGNNRIDWRRTVAHTQPFLQDGSPIYMDLENKKKVIDVDDRLLVLYFSAMHYIEETFGFKMPHSEFYSPMRVSEFRRILGHHGLVELRRIKHKYFADKFLKLYNIMMAFFEWGGNFSANDFSSEYLLTSKYNNVFEAMIDRLVGDENKDIDSLKQNDDGKIIDHLYKEKSLVFASGKDDDLIWHIGDSKYYQDPNDIQGQSVAKQFTYAKNVMQNFFSPDFINSGKDAYEDGVHRGVRYRDKLTEGYSVTPNFFIRGEVPKFNQDLAKTQFQDPYFRDDPNSEKEDLIRKDDADLWKDRNRHFENRLFDRDTLLLQVYNVNFLYVLKAYTSKRSSLREEFKRDARKKFRENFLKLLNEKYVFWAVWPKLSLAQDGRTAEKVFVDNHFRTLVGKIFKPEGIGSLILALETDSVKSKDAAKMWEEIEGDCGMIARVTPREIWEDDSRNLPETIFEQSIYDESFHGCFIRSDIFEHEKIGKECKLSSQIANRLVAGNVQYSDKNEYYFLPCKEN